MLELLRLFVDRGQLSNRARPGHWLSLGLVLVLLALNRTYLVRLDTFAERDKGAL